MYHGVFVEVELAKALGVSYEPYNEADAEAALISVNDAKRATIILTEILKEYKGNRTTYTAINGLDVNRLMPQIVASNVSGVGTLLSYHISDDNFIDVFTDGAVKTTDLYSAITQYNASARFSWDSTFQYIASRAKQQPTPISAVPESAPMSAMEEFNLAKECVSNYVRIFGGSVRTIKNEKHVLLSTSAIPIIEDKALSELADTIDKNIIVMQGSHLEQYTSKLDKNLFKDFMFLYYAHSDNNAFSILPSSGFKDQVCLGYYVDRSYAPVMVSGEKESPLSKYDFAMADRKTGIIFCLRKKNHLYLTATTNSTNALNKSYFDRLLKEVARRWNGDISEEELDKIDEEYNQALSQADKEDYVKFAVSSSNTYVKKIKTALAEGIKEIGDLQRQLAEKMKVYNQYVDIIENYDEKKQMKELEEKSIQAYNDVLKLPQVRSMFIKEGKINVFTNPIVAIDERTKKKHVLGSFHIRLNMLLDTYDIRESVYIKNITSPLVGAYGGVQEAPHIFDGGHMCHGNLINTVIECYANRDIYGLISSIVFFLEAANTADYAGQHVNKWPEYKEEENKTKVKDETDDELSEILTAMTRG